jgi:CheY-like chemotaxis protein
MARVLALIPDLLFGSHVQADMLDAGHEIELVSDEDAIHDRLAGVDVLIIDLVNPDIDGAGLVEALAEEGVEGASSRPRTLGFYAHIDVGMRQRAETAGFDLVVPRSRMAREGAALVGQLVEGD